jgi:hypothetical protein
MHTQSGAATFAACQQLFRYHPLAVAPSPAGPGGERRGLGSMVLRHRIAGFFVLDRLREDMFVLRSWDPRDAVEEEIRPGRPVRDLARQVVVACLPVPRHGALLGWVTCRQVTALLTVHSAPPAGTGRVLGPEVRVLPLDGTAKEWHWPPFTVSPLDDWRLWEYVEWRELVDVQPLLAAESGRAFWIPAADGRRTGHVVLSDNIRAEAFWLPEGVYCDHWALREGLEPPAAERLIASPGAVDLSRGGLWQEPAAGTRLPVLGPRLGGRHAWQRLADQRDRHEEHRLADRDRQRCERLRVVVLGRLCVQLVRDLFFPRRGWPEHRLHQGKRGPLGIGEVRRVPP